MLLTQIAIILFYSYVVYNICSYNHTIIKKVENINDSNQLQDILKNEYRFITYFTLASLILLVIFYFYVDLWVYSIIIVLTFIVQFSFSAMKKNILIQLRDNTIN